MKPWEHLEKRLTLLKRGSVISVVAILVRQVDGNIVEFGVADGTSTRLWRRALKGSGKRIFACDSFEGLSEKYEEAEIGAFACEPPRIRGVEIVKGYFEDSLTPELASRVGRVAMASLDADLYSSTTCALRWLTPLLGTGSLLLFDEFLGEKESEKRAFEDWLEDSGIEVVKIAEFLRDPSGFSVGSPDKRVLFQVVGLDELPDRAPTLKERLRKTRLAALAAGVRRRLRAVWPLK